MSEQGKTNMAHARTPNDIIRDPSISHCAKSLYTLLASYCGAKGSCYPSVTRLAYELATSESWIRRYMKELEGHGLLEIAHANGAKSTYRLRDTLNTPVMGDVTGDGMGDVTGGTPVMGDNQTPVTGDSLRSTGKKYNPTTPPSEVVAIYEAYPRKTKRPDALRAITRAIERGDSPADLLAATEAFAAHWRTRLAKKPDDRQFIPHPASWFNAEGYNDADEWGGNSAGVTIWSHEEISAMLNEDRDAMRKRRVIFNDAGKVFFVMPNDPTPPGYHDQRPDDAPLVTQVTTTIAPYHTTPTRSNAAANGTVSR